MAKTFYLKFRPFLFALSLGLACVWFYKGSMMSETRIDVILPETESGSVLFVFAREGRFMPSGGGSGHHRPQVLAQDSSNPIAGKLSFVMEQYSDVGGDEAAFINIRHSKSNRSVELVPYFMECQHHPGGRFVKIPQVEKNSSKPITVELNRDFTFNVDKPAIKGVCQIYVVVGKSETGAREAFFLNANQFESGQDFIDNVKYFHSGRFINK
ncbi:MAG: hypothetical protein WKF92_03800 [Pyrinomonadaceae bacterium]